MSNVVWSRVPYKPRYVVEKRREDEDWTVAGSSNDLEYIKVYAASWVSDGFFVRIIDREASE